MVRGWRSARCQKHTQKSPKMFSPGKAVAGEGVAAPRTVARTAAVLVEPPVSRHAAVAAGATDAGLTRAVPAGGVARRGGAERVTGTSCRWKQEERILINQLAGV